jgi:hypothetical protein
MKKILLSTLVAVLIISSSVHVSIMYLNYMRALGMGFTSGISLMTPDVDQSSKRDIFKIKD